VKKAPLDPSSRLERVLPSRAERTRRIIQYVGLFVLAIVAANVLLGERGLIETMRAQAEHEALTRTLGAIRAENRRILERIGRHDDPGVLEELARRDLGMIRPGEIVVVIKDAAGEAVTPQASGPRR
jgi:cell division protein FtsB